MNNLIVIKVNGVLPNIAYEHFKRQKVQEIKQGLLIADETIKDITLVSIDELGVEFLREEEHEKESV